MEVRSEPGVTSARVPLSIETQKTAPLSQSPAPKMRLTHTSDGTVIYKPIATISFPPYLGVLEGSSGGGSGTVAVAAASASGAGDGHLLPMASHGLNFNTGQPLKRKRGRPRKYRPDGGMAPVPPALRGAPSGSIAFSLTSPARVASQVSAPASVPAFEKLKGRPPSSGRKQQMDALGSGGIGFTPHVITVKAGEDVSSKIMSFSQHGPRAVCILSANGAISNVTLRQAATSGGTVTYEGRYEILSLSGSFLQSESDGHRSRTGGLSVSLAGPDGRVLGGGVAGLLTAASPVQVVVGSFIVDGHHEAKKANSPWDLVSAPSKLASGSSMSGPASPRSRGTVSESSGGPGSPVNQSTGACKNSNQQGVSEMPWK